MSKQVRKLTKKTTKKSSSLRSQVETAQKSVDTWPKWMRDLAAQDIGGGYGSCNDYREA